MLILKLSLLKLFLSLSPQKMLFGRVWPAILVPGGLHLPQLLFAAPLDLDLGTGLFLGMADHVIVKHDDEAEILSRG